MARDKNTPLRVLRPEEHQPSDSAVTQPVVLAPVPLARDEPAQKESQPSDAPAAESPAEAPKRPRTGMKRGLFAAAAVAVIAGGVWYGHSWYTVGRFIVSTDDAYVSAYNTTLAPKVPGYISEVAVQDNAYIHEGDIIARIDDGDYQLAVRTAQNRVATQQATIARLGQEIDPQRAAVNQAKAQVLSAKAARTRTQLELERQQVLARKDFASGQKLEAARADRDQAEANVQNAEAAVVAAQSTISVIEGKRLEAERTLDSLDTDLAKAERDLSFTVVRAPIDGVVGNRNLQVGDYVTPGARLASIVPLDKVFINANFKETQLAGLKQGQQVEITVDALPDHVIKGTVESLAPASGSVFSLLPTDNATGNFTKIVQRLPVRISVPAEILTQHILRPGMSVVVDVNTKHPAEAATASPAH
ncbi:MAG: HlyD family secretion protein [Rhodospirillales bacterium]|nr:HlyD family secretion protein [Rhodospirillales bacterium]